MSYDAVIYFWEEVADCPIEADPCERAADIRDFQKKADRQEWKAKWSILGREILNTSDGGVPVLELEDSGTGRYWCSPRRQLIIKQSSFIGSTDESIFIVPLGDQTDSIIRRDGKPF